MVIKKPKCIKEKCPFFITDDITAVCGLVEKIASDDCQCFYELKTIKEELACAISRKQNEIAKIEKLEELMKSSRKEYKIKAVLLDSGGEPITEDDIKQTMLEAQQQYKAGKLKFYNNANELFKDLGINIDD